MDPVLSEFTRIVPLLYHLGCVSKDPELPEANRRELRSGLIKRLLNHGMLSVNCWGCSKPTNWTITLKGCPEFCDFHKPRAGSVVWTKYNKSLKRNESD